MRRLTRAPSGPARCWPLARRWAQCGVLLPFLLLAGAFALPAGAHDARPLSIEITQQSADLYRARLRVPPTVPEDDHPTITWPANCRIVSDRITPDSVTPDELVLARCADGLDGRTLGVHYPIYNPSLSTLFRLTSPEGTVRTQVLAPDQPEWTVPPETTWKGGALGYVELGIRHIWTGLDHLLFVSGLLLLAGNIRRVLVAITGFTLAHSLTLSLSVLRIVQPPQPPVEAAIALSILFVAYEIARPAPNSIARRYPLVVSSCFGLLHGFGFAAALREAGLPPNEQALGLLSFNLGVELGQIAFIATAVAVVWPLTKAIRARLATPPSQSLWDSRWGYALGIPAAFWFFERIAALA